MSRILEVEGVRVRFGGVVAVDNVSFGVDRGDFLSLIGPNGAGKTTLLRAIIGVVQPGSARIVLDGHDITNLPIHKRTRLGLAMTHQIVRPFRSMTVLDNVTLAAGRHRLERVLAAMTKASRQLERERARRLLDLVGIGAAADKPIAGQPLGVLKRLEVARALALEPNILFLDEPLAGLNTAEAGRMADTIEAINQEGMTIFMIEHNLGEVLRVSRRLMVMDNGAKIADGPPDQVMRDPAVRAAYVGKESDDVAA